MVCVVIGEDLSKEADVLCQQVLSMRNELVGDLLTLAKEAGDALAPICRPMWWLVRSVGPFNVCSLLRIRSLIFELNIVCSC